MKSSSSRKVAVIGAGAAGLVAARELRREGHQVVVFERNNQVGGTWVYDPNVDSDPLGLDPSRTVVHTSLYQSLRTNLPRQVMGFRDYPFVAAAAAKQEFELDGDEEKKKRDSRRFPGHQEVLHYLNDFTTDFKLGDLIRFETEVVRVGLVEQGKWVVGYRRRRRLQAHADDQEELYDAVVVCNGHYSEPRVAQIPGIDVWPGKQIHSHNYRVPEPFSDQVVVVIGSSASAYDISRDIAKVANEVHVASRSITLGSPTKEFGYDNMWIHSMLQSAQEDGKVLFLDGTSVHVDVILHCTGLGWVLQGYMDEPGTVKNLSYSKTERKDLMNSFHLLHVGHCGKSTTTGLQQQGFDDGRGTMEIFNVMLNVKFMDVDCCYGTGTSRYKFHFPFLKIGDTVTLDDNRVGPLYKHIFPPSLTPWLSFIGLPWKVIPFPLCELQSKWVAAVLSGRVLLPSQEAMMSNVEAFYSNLESTGVPKRYTHNVASYQFEYCDWLAAECGYRASEEWRKQMYLANQKNRVARPETYRDEWEDQYLILQAEEDFLSNIPVEMDKTSVR